MEGVGGARIGTRAPREECKWKIKTGKGGGSFLCTYGGQQTSAEVASKVTEKMLQQRTI
jgi:hypothetical protein